MTQEEEKKLIKYREWLENKAERFMELACQPNASISGRHYDRGNANGLIQAKKKLENFFNL